jgi:hypothetical protein
MEIGTTVTGKATCEGCYFGQHGLCALRGGKPCPTFRPNRPEGLRPPSQLRFMFRQERSLQSAWAFPDAEAQLALHR